MKSLLQSTLFKDPDQTPGLEDKLQSTFPFLHSFPPLEFSKGNSRGRKSS